MSTTSQTQQPNPAPVPPAPASVPASPVPATSSGLPAWAVSALSVVGTMAVMGVCAGAGLLVLLRPGAAGPLGAAFGTGGFLLAGASPFVATALARRQR